MTIVVKTSVSAVVKQLRTKRENELIFNMNRRENRANVPCQHLYSICYRIARYFYDYEDRWIIVGDYQEMTISTTVIPSDSILCDSSITHNRM